MPEGKIENWKSDNDTCSFTVKGLAGIGMKKESSESGKNVHITSHGKNPFDFTLDIDFKDNGDSCNTQLTFDGNMNFMIQTMASGPLTNLFNIMADNLVKKFS
jgi:carbon monoxide dehydrogenase subunit G